MKYFNIKELTASSTATKFNIDNTPNKVVEENLIYLVDNILDKAREALNKPIHINSGYRCPELNKKVGGAVNSQHVTGEAVDIELGTKTIAENRILFDWIKDNCTFDQLIWEKGGAWIHVSLKQSNNRNQTFNLG